MKAGNYIRNKNGRIIEFHVSNKYTDIVTKISEGFSTRLTVLNDSFCDFFDYVNIGDMVIFESSKRGSSDVFYSLVRLFDTQYDTREFSSEGKYIAFVKSPKLLIHKS